MQVVILCGGQGTRIRDVADDIPKPMIPVGDRPIVWHIMKSYAQYGFTDRPSFAGTRIAQYLEQPHESEQRAQFLQDTRIEHFSYDGWNRRPTLDAVAWSDSDRSAFLETRGSYLQMFDYPCSHRG